ncbi:hypothetical protein ILUMI_02066 [Ignelater luminosus]|uniref:Uncharacterized protein n=1 Tax=Ignelater luminosus TaxID=2038154 RepID=A0A8K0DJ08_IGNLU|nr:hypothetical protein ILUMI_02066 [Ignelater luminosus]
MVSMTPFIAFCRSPFIRSALCHRARRLEETDKDIDHVTGFTLNDAKRIWRSLRSADYSTVKPSSKQTSVDLIFKYKGQLYINNTSNAKARYSNAEKLSRLEIKLTPSPMN